MLSPLHTHASDSFQGKRITKPWGSIPWFWWGSSNHPNPIPEGILNIIKPQGTGFSSLRTSQAGFCFCSAFPRKCHYVRAINLLMPFRCMCVASSGLTADWWQAGARSLPQVSTVHTQWTQLPGTHALIWPLLLEWGLSWELSWPNRMQERWWCIDEIRLA